MITETQVERRKIVFDADGYEYWRVFFVGQDRFVDVPFVNYHNWLDATGNYE